MEKLNINLENCYGISKLSEELGFLKDNVIAIYARNGLMKTSFTKTFKKIQEDKVDEVKDEVFGIDGTVEVLVDGCTIAPKDIFVINSYEAFYESENVSKLLVDNDIKNKIDSLIKLKDKFLKLMEKYSGLKVVKTSQGIKRLFEFAETITVENADLEYKIILSMAIRHKAEKFMLTKIKSYPERLTWKRRRNLVTGNVSEFLEYISLGGNQTRELFNAYAQFGEQEKIKALSEVNIMTPENIHVNSFMYEPILDMDMVELIGLYNRVKMLSE